MLFVFSAIAFATNIEIVDEVLAHQRRNNPKSLSNTREKSWQCFHEALVALKAALVFQRSASTTRPSMASTRLSWIRPLRSMRRQQHRKEKTVSPVDR